MAIENFQRARHSLVCSAYYMPQPWDWKNFQDRSSDMGGNHYFEFDFEFLQIIEPCYLSFKQNLQNLC